jgi:hypothetical protein
VRQFIFGNVAKITESVMPVSNRIRDDVSGIQTIRELLDSGFRQNDKISENGTFSPSIIFGISSKAR